MVERQLRVDLGRSGLSVFGHTRDVPGRVCPRRHGLRGRRGKERGGTVIPGHAVSMFFCVFFQALP
jgi:hypothetical protein